MSAMTPKPAPSVPRAIRSGMAAAIGLRNTNSRTTTSTGKAISSPLWTASTLALLRSRPNRPDRWVSTGASMRLSTKRSSGGTIVFWFSPSGISRLRTIMASRGPGRRRAAPRPPVHGESVRVWGRRRSAAASRDPCRSTSLAGPRRSTAAGSPRCPSMSCFQRCDSVPGTESVVGISFCSTPRPAAASTATASVQPTSTSTGRRIANCARRVIKGPPAAHLNCAGGLRLLPNRACSGLGCAKKRPSGVQRDPISQPVPAVRDVRESRVCRLFAERR